MIKVGYFRCVSKDKLERYIAYDEFKTWDEESRMILRDRAINGTVSLYCACQADNTSELSITANGVIRVAENGQQSYHMDSCPKSESYAGFCSTTKKGALPAMDQYGNSLCFAISLPNLIKSKSKSSSSGGTGTGVPREKKTDLLSLIQIVNRYAWLIQTYSIKKKISQARKAGEEPIWSYKNLEDFNKLFFGVANDIYVKVNGAVATVNSICYRKDMYAQCMDTNYQFLIYAVIDKIGEYKASRKYQYVTVKMPSDKSPYKSVIRVETSDYLDMFEKVEKNSKRNYILAGYIRKAIYPNEEGAYDAWMTLTRGIVVEVTDNGLMVESESIKVAAEILTKRKVIFQRPYLPIENYGNEVPAFLIERYNDKNILIDIPIPDTYSVKQVYAQDNEEFECYILKEGLSVVSEMNAICDTYYSYKNKEN